MNYVLVFRPEVREELDAFLMLFTIGLYQVG